MDRNVISAAINPLTLPDDELEALAKAVLALPRASVRLRPDIEPSQLPFATTPVPWHPHGRFVEESSGTRERPGNRLEFIAGDYYPQDAGSMLALALLQARPGESICDLCAAPGGKSTAILESLGDRGWLLANEAVQSRAAVLQFNLARHGATRYFVSTWDPETLAERLAGRHGLDFQFDAVLVDAPCSGQSLVGRGKQSLSAFAPTTMEHCAARQARILDAAEPLVRSGGRLVYSTCTLAYVENERQIRDFVARHPAWRVEQPEESLVAACGGAPSPWGLRIWPHHHGCGGAFAARLRKGASDDASLRDDASTTDSRRTREAWFRPGELPAEFAEWGILRQPAVYHHGLQCFGWPADAPRELLAISQSGPEIAFCKSQTWFPSYALAMRRDADWRPHRNWELDDRAARLFAQGQVLPGSQRGWSIATWRGRPLGWLKGDGRQGKNHLPKGGRLAQ